MELQGVAEEVLEELDELHAVAPDSRQLAVRDLGSGLLDAHAEVAHGLAEHREHVDRDEFPAPVPTRE